MATADAPMEALLETYKALADETRLRILGLVAERPHNGRQLADALGITQPAVSHHVERLRRVGLLRELREGKERIYGLNRERLSSLAREQLAQTRVEVEDDAGRVLREFFDGYRLRSIPAQRKKRVVVLRELLKRFEPERRYAEREVNDILGRAHEDVATLRRELIMYGFMNRERGEYWLVASEPDRGRNVAQEIA
jgi:biotin operon repressor